MLSIALSFCENLLNSFLRLYPEAPSRLAKLEGNVIAIEVTGINIKFYLVPKAKKIHLQPQSEKVADVVISGSPLSLLKLVAKQPRNGLLLEDDVIMTGNVDIAHELQVIFTEFPIDWEEQLSHYFGDIFAHQVGNTVRKTSSWIKQTGTSLEQNFTEYLQEELRFLPPGEELQHFYSSVDQLRDNNERMAARVERLEKMLHKDISL